MSTEDIIKRILTLKPNLTEDAVRQLIIEERVKAEGLLTMEAAAHLVASNLGINGMGEKIEAKLKIGDITAGLSDVNLTGRIIHIFRSHIFDREDNRKGKVLRMILGDETSHVTVVFWDEKADHVEASKLAPGKIVRILHGYSRERRGKIEINMGNRGQVFMEPMDVVKEDYPKISSFFLTPADIYGEGDILLEGVVMDSSPMSTFKRDDGSEGKVSRLLIEEGGGRINAVLWDDKVDEFGYINRGTKIRIIGGNVRTGNMGKPEVHVGWASDIEIVQEGVRPIEPVPYWTKLGDLKDGMSSINVAAMATQVSEVREFIRRDGTEGRVVSVLLEDETGTVRLSLWDDDIDLVERIKENSIIVVENGYTRAGFGGVDLNAGRNGRLHLDPDELDVELPEIERRIVNIMDLRAGQKNITVQGQVLDDPLQRDIETVRGPATVTNFRIDDRTGEARVSLWREYAEEAMDIPSGAEVRLEYMNVREPFDGLIQLSSGSFTKIIVLKE
jgi:ssDNA-binding replication factor A large subunit